MAPNGARFTERLLQGLRPAHKRTFVFDPTLPAFGLRVEPTGVKTFQLSYRVGGRLRMATLGRLGVVTLDQARREARRMLGDVAAGADPLALRDASRRAISVRTATDRWIDEFVSLRRKSATLRNYRLAVDHIGRVLGSIPVEQLTASDAARLHNQLKSTPYLANRVLAALSSCLTWCEREGYRAPKTNPCIGIERYPEKAHKRYLNTAEYHRLGKALRKAERQGRLSATATTATKLLLLTGCRPAEIMSLRWDAVDLRNAILKLADSKTGAKTIHLSAESVKTLRKWPRHVGSDFVFPASGRRAAGKHRVSLTKPWKFLRDAAKLPGVRLYDACRHSFASVAISQHGHALSVIGELLGHSQAATTKRYSHLHDEVAHRAARKIGGTIASALAG